MSLCPWIPITFLVASRQSENGGSMRASTGILVCLIVASGAACQQSSTPTTNPCAASEQRQFDFWMGEWEAYWPGNKESETQQGSNSIRRVLDGCVVEENFSGGHD